MVKSLIKKIEKGVRKGRDKLKEGLGDLANVIGDKLVPKEAAPFLPLLAFVPGLNVGLGSLLGLNPTLAQYLIPQLLTAASTGKTRGDIDLGAQAVTAAGSFLSDPNRFQFGTKVTGGDPVFTDPTIDPGYVTGGETVPMEFADITNPSFTDRLKNIGNVSRDFFQGDLPAFDKFRRPILDPETGLQLTVKDAGLASNVPRLATATGIGLAPGAMSYIDTKTEEAEREEEEAAERSAEALAARGALTDYFFNLSDPMNRFRDFRIFASDGGIASLSNGVPKDMQVDGRNGTFIPMGVKEKADDVPAMLSKNEFVMTADAVRAMGEGDVNRGAQRMYDLMNSLEAMA
jgi:hypothetical protein